VTTTARTLRWYWEDFPVGHTRAFGPVTLTRDEVIEFARRYDPQPFHLDDAAAEASLFGRLAASGWHTAALTMRMMCDAYLLDAASLGSPGLDELKWLKPVYPGDTLSGTMTVLESRPSAKRPELGLVKTRWDVVNQDGAPVMTMTGWNLYRRRDPGVAAGVVEPS
jgi:acyl dehydratase